MSLDPEPATTPDRSLIERVRRALGDRYEVRGELGSGGMATVLLAHDRKHSRAVAIKVLHQRLTAGSGADRFRREIAIAAQLAHPHVVPLHDSGVADGLPYYVMPFIDGQTLKGHLASSGKLGVHETLAVARDVADALDHAHHMGIVHRDIKPANILLTAGHALVSDFGVARALEAATVEDVTLTEGAPVGTPAYMSPEQALADGEVDGRTDVYALGCLVYEMLSGERPYTARTAAGLLGRHVQGPVPSLVGRDGIPVGVAEAIERALAKDPVDRFETAGAFVAALEEGARSRSARRFWRARTHRVGAIVLVTVAVSAALFIRASTHRRPPGGAPRSVVVLPYETSTSTDEERVLAADLAADITVELNHWDAISAVPRVALAGPMFDLGVRGPTFRTVESGLDVGRVLGVDAVLAVHVELRGDTADVEGNLFDVASGASSGRPLVAAAPRGASDLPRIIAYGMLGLDDATLGSDLHLLTSSPEALRAFARANRALERWQLPDARVGFADAIARDSTFALAYLRLAQTLYWGAAGDPHGLTEVGDDLARLSALAARNAAGLSARDSLHVLGFYEFQAGAYEEARSIYRELLDRQPSDVYALLMLGSVEYSDPWLAETPDGLRPRSNLNVAIRSFEEALRLQPTFELGYGHLFDIHAALTRAASFRACQGFEEPRDEYIAPWDDIGPERKQAFCPVVSDSISWMAYDDFMALDPAPVRLGADRLFRQSLRMLRRWVAFAPDQPKPLQELAAALTAQRLNMRSGAPQELAALAQEARDALSKALSMMHDTVPADLFRLANLKLAAGDPEGALELVDRERARGGGRPPDFALNTYLANGRIQGALDLASSERVRLFLEGDSDRLIPYGGAESVLDRAAMTVGLTEGTDLLRDELKDIRSRWAGDEYSDADRRVLEADATTRLLAALASDSLARREWAAGVSVDQPLWNDLIRVESDAGSATGVPPDTAEARRVLGPASRSFVSGRIAYRAGRFEEAARSFSRLDSLALSVEFFDPGWELWAVSMFWAGRSYEAAGDTGRAVGAYERFASGWARADDLALPLVRDARARVSRLMRDP